MTPDTLTAAPAPSRAEQINRAIAEKIRGWPVFGQPWKHDGTVVVIDDDGAQSVYDPCHDAGQAFELVERFRLMPSWLAKENVWSISTSISWWAKHPDLKTAICLCVLRMHGVDPEYLEHD